MNRKENEMTVTESLEKTPVEIQEVKICRDMQSLSEERNILGR